MASKRAQLIRHLAQAQKAVELGAANIHRQHEIVTELERRGYSTSLAKALLQTYLETQALQEHDLQHIADELGVPPEARVLQ